MKDYRAAAEALFEQIDWHEDGVGLTTLQGLRFELRPTNGSLSICCRAEGTIEDVKAAIAYTALAKGLVTIDVQTSKLVVGAEAAPACRRWSWRLASLRW